MENSGDYIRYLALSEELERLRTSCPFRALFVLSFRSCYSQRAVVDHGSCHQIGILFQVSRHAKRHHLPPIFLIMHFQPFRRVGKWSSPLALNNDCHHKPTVILDQ